MLAQYSWAIQTLGLPAASIASLRVVGGSCTLNKPSWPIETQRQHGKGSGSTGRGPNFRVTDILGTAFEGIEMLDASLVDEWWILIFFNFDKSILASDFRLREGALGGGSMPSMFSSLTIFFLALSLLGISCF